MQLTSKQISAALSTGAFTNEELDQVIIALKFAQKELNRVVRNELFIGTKVRFNTEDGEVVGKVHKIGPKYIQVDVGTTRWRIIPRRLTVE